MRLKVWQITALGRARRNIRRPTAELPSIGGRRGAIVAAGLLGIAIVVDGMPIWGSDIGGVLSMVPAYGVVVSGLMGWRVRLRTDLDHGITAPLLAILNARPRAAPRLLGRSSARALPSPG